MKVCLVSFSGRSGGNCGGILRILKKKYGGETEAFDFSELSVAPCGKCNYECFRSRTDCPFFHDSEYAICDSIVNSDFACFIVPNYCNYPCSNFFIFNERSQCYFQHHQDLLNVYLAVRKKFIVISNTEQDNFTQAFRYHVSEESTPDVLFLSAKQYHKKSIDGDLTELEDVRETIFRFVEK